MKDGGGYARSAFGGHQTITGAQVQIAASNGELEAALGRMEALARPSIESVEFARALHVPAVAEVSASWEAVLDEVWLAAVSPVCVETLENGAIAARTIIQYSGDTHSLYALPPSPPAVRAHAAALQHAIDRRQKALRLLSVAVRVMASIAAVSANPALSLPSILCAWKLTQEVRETLDALLRIGKSTPE